MPLRTVNDARELVKRVLAASDVAPLHCGACNQAFTAKRSLVRHLEESRCPTLRAADKDIQTALAAELRPSPGMIIRGPSPPPSPSSQGPYHAFAVALTLCAPDAFAFGPIEPTYNRSTTWLRMQSTAASPSTFWVSVPALRTVRSGRALLKRIERRRGSSLAPGWGRRRTGSDRIGSGSWSQFF